VRVLGLRAHAAVRRCGLALCGYAPSIVDERRARVQMRLKELLKNRLMEAGWHDEMADYCRGARVFILPNLSVRVKERE
jgi:hypothetical protein